VYSLSLLYAFFTLSCLFLVDFSLLDFLELATAEDNSSAGGITRGKFQLRLGSVSAFHFRCSFQILCQIGLRLLGKLFSLLRLGLGSKARGGTQNCFIRDMIQLE